MRRALLCAAAALVAACNRAPSPPPAPSAPVTPAPTTEIPLDVIPRLEWNRLAAELDLPLFWIADGNANGAIDPDELAVLWGVASPETVWVKDGAFTPAFQAAYVSMARARALPAEKGRLATVRAELAQGMPSLIRSDFRTASPEDRAIVEHVVAAATIIERLFAKQRGVAGLAAEIPEGDAASRMLFYRNQGPWCQAPRTEKDPDCNALARHPAHVVGLYPASVQKDPKFCEVLDKRPDQKALLTPFNVVVEQNGDLAPVPYNVAYKDDMEAVSRELAAAAQAIVSPGEAALKTYLEADAKAFLDNGWEAADEAWAKMGVNNSKWYVRVAPDETYADPCSRKAGFQVSFARINQDSIAWQQKLDPRKTEMEAALAKLAGPPYQARSVTFHLPDFIDVVLNAGDSRAALGATIGESLPNWGPVANEGRGRTVAMTNFYTDPDSRAAGAERASAILCKSSLDPAALDPALVTMGTVLHEASHNLGPANEYKVGGKTGSEIFGGPLASMFEELKAQTSSLYFADWLADNGLLDKKTAALGHLSDILWAFGHISEGMYGGDGSAKPYSHLASIQIGWFLEAGAIAYRPDETAANGRDKGCFELVPAKLPAAITSLEKTVLGTLGRGDKEAAVKLKERLVDADGEWKRLRGVVTERWLRQPKASFVYAIER
jgi:hypothetical protein